MSFLRPSGAVNVTCETLASTGCTRGYNPSPLWGEHRPFETPRRGVGV